VNFFDPGLTYNQPAKKLSHECLTLIVSSVELLKFWFLACPQRFNFYLYAENLNFHGQHPEEESICTRMLKMQFLLACRRYKIGWLKFWLSFAYPCTISQMFTWLHMPELTIELSSNQNSMSKKSRVLNHRQFKSFMNTLSPMGWCSYFSVCKLGLAYGTGFKPLSL